MSLLIQYQTSTDDNKYDVFSSASQKQYQTHSLLVSESTTLFRSKTTHQILQQKKIPSREMEGFEPFLVVEKNEEQFLVANAHDSCGSDKNKEMLCLVAKQNSPQQTLPLKEGKVIRLGIAKLKIQTLKVNQQRKNRHSTFYDEKYFSQIVPNHRIGVDFYEDSAYASTISEAPTCRYCFSKSLDSLNEFLSLCKCEGSSKYVHMQCLSAWVIQRCQYKEVKQGIFIVNRKGLSCEICKAIFPLEQVLPCFQDPQFKEYLIVSTETQKQQIVYIIKLGESCEWVIGRKSDCHLTLDDPSVSRIHCSLIWDNERGQISIRDEESKFGTLVKKSSMTVNHTLILQRGRVRLTLEPVSRKSAFAKSLKDFFSFSKYGKS